MNRLAVIITSELNNINKVEDFIERTIKEFKLSENLRGKITLAVIEAVNNSILYGNKQNPQKLVKLTAFKGHQRVIFTVEDGGEGFDFNNIPDPTTPENLIKVTGLKRFPPSHFMKHSSSESRKSIFEKLFFYQTIPA